MARLRSQRPGGIGGRRGGRPLRKGLTNRQSQILTIIRRHVLEKGYPPSVREIGEAVGLRSSSTVHGYLGRLEQKGYIRRDPTKPRTIEIMDRDDTGTVLVPLVGRVTPGQPVLTRENVERLFPLPRDLARGEGVFMLRVGGDVRVRGDVAEAGIRDDDLVVVRPQAETAPGDLVVALVGNGDGSILGKVIGLFRRLF